MWRALPPTGHATMTRTSRSPESDSRRSFLRKGALTSGALALGLGGAGGEAAGDEGSGAATQGGKALMFNDQFRPGAQFRVKSPVLDRNPDVRGVQQGDLWSQYNTRLVEYLNTNEEVYLFPARAAGIRRGEVYELQTNFTLFGDTFADEGLVTVSFQPVPQGDALIGDPDGQLEPGDDFGILQGGGKALVDMRNFSPGALLRITSPVVQWVPGPDVQGSDVFSGYNTRHAEYLNTNEEFPIYTAHSGDFQQGGVYVLRNEFDITDPEGQLVTADLDKVNEGDLPDNLLGG